MHRTTLTRIAAALVATFAVLHAHAGPELMELEAAQRAKVAKKKLEVAAAEREASARGERQQRAADCGSQSIGNVNTGGQIGAAPREVFVFAPNSINIVGRGGCR